MTKNMKSVSRIIERGLSGEELSADELTALLSISDEGARRELHLAANETKVKLWGGRVTYVVNLNLNFTNVCVQHCGFCNFRRDETAPDSYRLTIDECLDRIAHRMPYRITEVAIQAGLEPATPVEFYFTLIREIKGAFPKLHIHAYSPEEIAYLNERSGESYEDIIERLREAGLGSMPGTAAEILVDSVRRKLCAEKIMTGDWCRIVETAHSAGVRTTSTMMYGHIEKIEDRAEHLRVLREVQRRTGGFTEFIGLPFVPLKAPIALRRNLKGPSRDETLDLIAASRLFFGTELPHIQAVPWVKRGLQDAIASLRCGADDLGGTLIEEKISRASGANHGSYVPATKLAASIIAEGLRPVERTTLYSEVKEELEAA